MTIVERFEANIARCPMSGCWLWLGTAGTKGGYGRLRIEGTRWIRAHRFAWQLWRGHIPDGLSVLHRCDTPLCVNPNHLFLGTPKDNVADMVAKGREAKGEVTGNHRIKAAQVPTIRADSRKPTEIAVDYMVHEKTIRDIKTGRTWKHIAA